MVESIIWIAATIIFGIAEAATAAVVSIWFVAGALFALGLSALGVPFGFQIAGFAVASVGSLLTCRRLVLKSSKRAALPKDNDIVNKTAVVVTPITPTQPGQIKIDGVCWSARALDPETSFAENERVIVCARSGLFCIVDKYDI